MAEPSGLSPREFLDKLRSGTLAEPVEVVGMVREIEGDDESLEFSVDCARWISIPIEMVESVHSLGVMPCKDHTHHGARVRLKEPQSDEATVFARLLGHRSNGPAMSGPIAPMPVDPDVIRCRRECYDTYTDWDERQQCLDGCVPPPDWWLSRSARRGTFPPALPAPYLQCIKDCNHEYPHDSYLRGLCKQACKEDLRNWR
jgi:hypothetical protein